MPESNLQSLSVDDFSGGMTDTPIAAQPNQFEMADNFVLLMHGGKGKLKNRPGSQIYDSSYYQIPAGSQRLVDLDDLEDQLLQFSARGVYYISSGWQTLTGPTSNPALSAGAATDYISKAKWNRHLIVCNDALTKPMKIFKDSGGTWRVRNLGLPAITTSGVTLTPTAGANTYIYTFILSDSYTIGTVTYREVSETATKTISAAAAPNVSTIAITNIPVLANGGTGNYNTAGIKVEIYRTIAAGSVFYKVGEVTNGTTSYNDTMSDATLITQTQLYTEGDVVDYEQVDPAKYVIVANDTAFYLHVQEDSTTYPNRIRQSIQGALYASPRDFYKDLDEEIVGGGVSGTNPIVFCKNGKIYRLSGSIDDQGRGQLDAIEISRTVTCVSHRSVVEARDGLLYFAAEDGFYRTNGFSVEKVTEEIPDTYADIVQSTTLKARIYGCYDKTHQRVLYACQRDAASNDNDSIICLHLKWENVPITTWSGYPTIDNFAPTCLRYFGGYMLRGDRRGYLFEHRDSYLSDAKIDTLASPSTWYKHVIFPDYRSSALDFGDSTYRKWVSEIIVFADNVTNAAVLIQSNNDNSGSFNDLKEIKYTSEFTWGSPTFVWGDSTFTWDYSAVINAWRRFPAGSLRCNYKQIRISPNKSLIDSYASVATANTDGPTNKITLTDLTKSWTDDPVDYEVRFDTDSYTDAWVVSARDSDTVLTLTDTGNSLATTPARNWKMYGYQKDQVISLLSYTIRFASLSRTQNQWDPTTPT